MSIYQRRWSSAGNGTTPDRSTTSTTTRTTPRADNVLSSGIEPSTVGTSWNSVRWNKPSTSYRASLASRFENTNSSPNTSYTPQRTSRFLSSAARNAAEVASIGPSVTARASRFDSSNMPNKEKYRTEARDLISKWSSRERGNNIHNTYRSPAPSSRTFRSTDSLSTSLGSTTSSYPTAAYRTSTSLTPTRPVVPSRYTERTSILSPSPTPVLHTTPKADRPWRQRMAESSRIRSTLGDDVSEAYSARRARNASSRRGSLSQDENNDTHSHSHSVVPYAYRSRQSSVESSVFSPTSRFTSATTSSYVPYSSRIRDTVVNRSKSPTRETIPRQSTTTQQIPSNPSIRESSRERDAEKKRKSAKERTARRNSRQNSQQDSSSDEEINRIMRSRSSSVARRKPRKKMSVETEKLVINNDNSIIRVDMNNKSMQSSLYETGPEDSMINSQLTASLAESIQALAAAAAENDNFHSCAASPLAPSVSRSSSKNGVVKNQIIKSPSLIEVLGLPKSESKTSLAKFNIDPDDDELTNELIDDEPSESSRLDDESQYSAVAHFKPNKIKRIAPVPGMWKKSAEDNEEFISRNKHFAKEPSHAEAEIILRLKNLEKIIKKLKAVEPKKKPVILKTKVEPNKEEKKVVAKPVEAPKKVVVEAPKVAVKPVEVPNNVEEPKIAPKAVEPVKKPVEAIKMIPKVEPKVEEPKIAPKAAVAPKAPEPIKPTPAAAPKPVEAPKVAPKPVEAVKPTPKTPEVAQKPAETPKPVTPGVEKKKLVLKKKKLVPVEDQKIEISKSFSRKAWGIQKAQMIMKVKNRQKSMFKCKSAGNTTAKMGDHFRRIGQNERATVLVDTPITDVNHSAISMKLREKRKKVPQVVAPPPIVNIPESIMTTSITDSIDFPINSRSTSVASETRASVILDEMRYTEAAVEWSKQRDSDDDMMNNEGLFDHLLVLPDQSILEQYVQQRKRGKLDRYRGLRRPSSSRGYESSNCASPCPSTVSELCLPSSVLIHEPRKRAPNSVEPYEQTAVQMNSTPRGFTRKQPPPQPVKPVPFEAPKTLFEKMIQDQANRNRANLVVTDDENETRDPSPRRGSQEEGMSSISQQFAAAAAAGNPHGSVRYAAHIPVRNGEQQSGRVSTSSVDSQQSGGALDVASKNIDHVIDQARHRHHQHRSKFKEAIDYLDQIFEDLKKECDPDEKNNNENEPLESTVVPSAPQPKIQVASQIVTKPKTSATATIVKPIAVKAKPVQKATQKVVKPLQKQSRTSSSPVEVVIPVRKVSSAAKEDKSVEPTVAETIVLAKKTDKMDFTRRWLHDDLASLAHLPPANIAPNASYYQDFDEHSLGSCSAEVAAFNTVKDKKTSKTSRKTSDTSTDPIRPRPFRPQPVYPMNDNGIADNYTSLPRGTSTDQIPNEMKRSGSQDPYNTLRSMRSEGDNQLDSLRPSPSAFQQVPQFNRNGSMRSSLRSLPDHSPIRQRNGQKMYDIKDPVLSIDALVAELELNTEQPTSSADKRRSFPTTFGRQQQPQQHGHNDYEKPNRFRAEIRTAPARGRAQNFASAEPAAPKVTSKAQIYSQPHSTNNAKIRDNIHRQQKSLDEVTNMLSKVVSQFGPNEPKQHPSVYKQLSQQSSFGSMHGNNAFETINQEKINPSRVEAMHNMFEKGTAPTAWKMHQPQNYKQREESIDQKMSPLHEAQYATLNSYSPSQVVVAPQSMPRNSSQSQISYHEYTPQLPSTQPPQRPPGSANSSNGGYYSSNSSGIGTNYPQQHNNQQHHMNPRRSLIIDQQSISSRVPSVDNDDDDGFYDNIGIYNDDRRFSRGSELDAPYRHHLPPSSSTNGVNNSTHKHNRIGSFLRKIGGGGNGSSSHGNRPPGSAASLMSLNKISAGNETIMKPAGGLMKSNSLSMEPWKKQILSSNSSMPREANNNQKTGLGARLKNSLFGSRKRLDG